MSEIMSNKEYIVWIDMEMTGLDIEKDHILEIACIITDKNLNIVSEELNIVIHLPDTVLCNMNVWCAKVHRTSGLIEESRSSTISLKAAEQTMLTFLQKYIPKATCPLAGSSVWMDRWFLCKHMPIVNDYLHYRIIDISSLKELARRWYLDVIVSMPQKQLKHRALSDIKESIAELIYYRQYIFK